MVHFPGAGRGQKSPAIKGTGDINIKTTLANIITNSIITNTLSSSNQPPETHSHSDHPPFQSLTQGQHLAACTAHTHPPFRVFPFTVHLARLKCGHQPCSSSPHTGVHTYPGEWSAGRGSITVHGHAQTRHNWGCTTCLTTQLLSEVFHLLLEEVPLPPDSIYIRWWGRKGSRKSLILSSVGRELRHN